MKSTLITILSIPNFCSLVLGIDRQSVSRIRLHHAEDGEACVAQDKALDRTDEVALLLQLHKVAKQSTLLLLLGPNQEGDEEAEHKHGSMESSTQTPELHPQR